MELYQTTAANGDVVIPAPEQAAIDKLTQQLRGGLASVDLGRFSVKRFGNLAYVTVNTKQASKPKKSVPKKAPKE